MSQMQKQKTDQPTIERSEEFVDRLGHNIGSFAAFSWQHIQQTATQVVERATTSAKSAAQLGATEGKQPNHPEAKPSGGMPQAEIQRAERVVDNIGQHLGRFASIAGLQARKIAAYTREGGEDIWAEAQYIRAARTRHNNSTGSI